MLRTLPPELSPKPIGFLQDRLEKRRRLRWGKALHNMIPRRWRTLQKSPEYSLPALKLFHAPSPLNSSAPNSHGKSADLIQQVQKLLLGSEAQKAFPKSPRIKVFPSLIPL